MLPATLAIAPCQAMFTLLASVLAIALVIDAGAHDQHERLETAAKIGHEEKRALAPTPNPEA